MNRAGNVLYLAFSLLLIAPSSWGRIVSKEGDRGETVEYVDGMVLVGIKPGRSLGSSAQVLQRLPDHHVVALRVPAGQTVESYIQRLKNNPNVEYAEPNHVYRANLSVNDTDFPNQHYLKSDLLNIEAAWDITTSASSIVIAVLDTGITLTHDNLMPRLWTDPSNNPSPPFYEGKNGTRIAIDYDGDGDTNDPEDQAPSTDPTDDYAPYYHGTRVAGIIAAEANDADDIAGIAFNSQLMAVKVLDSNGGGTTLSITEGIDYAVRKGADIINMSLGGPFSDQTLTNSVEAAIAADVIVVAAAGNVISGSANSCAVNVPGSIEGVITVGASSDYPSRDDKIASFSCIGPEVDVVAPGVQILSTIAPDGTDNTLDGTSFATPMVSGVVALMLSLNPTLTVEEVTLHLDFNALDLGPAGFDNYFGFGRVRPVQTLQSVQSGSPPLANPATPGKTFPYPNPFNPVTGGLVSFSVPAGLGESGIKIEIFDIKGRKVKTLSDTHKWDGKNDDGHIVASGHYFYVLQTDAGDTTGKLTILK